MNDLKSLYEALGVGYSTAPSSSVEIMVVYAFATWCGYCQRGMPIFNDQALRSNTKFAFFFNASTPDRRAAFKTITGQDIHKFPTIFVFYGTSKGRKASQITNISNLEATRNTVRNTLIKNPEAQIKIARSHCNKLANIAYGKGAEGSGKWCYPPYTENGIHTPYLPWSKLRASNRKHICDDCSSRALAQIQQDLNSRSNWNEHYLNLNHTMDNETIIQQFKNVKKTFAGGRRRYKSARSHL